MFCPRAGLSLQTQPPKLQFSTANSGTKVAVLLGMNRCGRFPLLSAPNSPFSISTNLKRSEKIPGAPARKWREWIWLTGSSGLHRNSQQGLNRHLNARNRYLEICSFYGIYLIVVHLFVMVVRRLTTIMRFRDSNWDLDMGGSPDHVSKELVT